MASLSFLKASQAWSSSSCCRDSFLRVCASETGQREAMGVKNKVKVQERGGTLVVVAVLPLRAGPHGLEHLTLQARRLALHLAKVRRLSSKQLLKSHSVVLHRFERRKWK